jgi:hypothetical protein
MSRLPFYIKLEATAHLTSNFAYLLLAFLCVLLHPAPSSAAPAATGWMRAVLVDLPIFVATTFSVSVFYLCAQRELYPREWKREIWFFPFVLALSIGVSINNARAVLEAIFNKRSEFTRTPKYGIKNKGDRWRDSRYSALRTLIPIVELLFAIYFTYFVFKAFQNSEFLSVPFLMLFQVGFAYVALSSIRKRIGRLSWGSQDISAA